MRRAAERRPAPAVLLVNTRARAGRKAFRPVQRALSERGVALSRAWAVAEPEAIAPLVREALADGARLILVGGGDGTLSAAASVLTGTQAVLGVLPLGTGNDFSRSLSIPRRLGAACEVIARGRVKAVDV